MASSGAQLPRPAALLFDLNGTLFPVDSAAATFRQLGLPSSAVEVSPPGARCARWPWSSCCLQVTPPACPACRDHLLSWVPQGHGLLPSRQRGRSTCAKCSYLPPFAVAPFPAAVVQPGAA